MYNRDVPIRQSKFVITWILRDHNTVMKRQQFFFEKKNQKTFAPKGRKPGQLARFHDKSFLVLFFKKELLPSGKMPIRNYRAPVPSYCVGWSKSLVQSSTIKGKPIFAELITGQGSRR